MNPINTVIIVRNKRCLCPLVIAMGSILLTACGEDSKATFNKATKAPPDTALISTLIDKPQPIKQIKATELDQMLGKIDPYAASLTPTAKCDVQIDKITYRTVGAGGEPTTATAAVMLPAGNNVADCGGERPILLYAHGTAVTKAYDFTQVGHVDNEAGVRATNIAANFAAQGYVVVAPNYAGYDTSPLTYTPYLNAKQQSHEMATALASARAAIKLKTTSQAIKDSGKLFISGYSQGGHTALATAQYLQLKGEPVTALAPMSGPYAMAAFGDQIFMGAVNIGATVFAPMIAISYQKQYGNLYNQPSELITGKYANSIETLIPGKKGFNELFLSGALPMTALFEQNPVGYPVLQGLSPKDVRFAYGFSADDYLVNTDFRAKYVADAIKNPDGIMLGLANGDNMPMPAADPKSPMRQALKANDLRNFIPTMPTLFCGGNQDPMVFFDTNTGSMNKVLTSIAKGKANDVKLDISILDVDATNANRRQQPTLSFIGNGNEHQTTLKTAQQDVQAKFADSYGKLAKQSTVLLQSGYHSTLVAPACTAAVRAYFAEFK